MRKFYEIHISESINKVSVEHRHVICLHIDCGYFYTTAEWSKHDENHIIYNYLHNILNFAS